MAKPKSAIKTPASSQLRLIGGQWRGRKLSFIESDGLRPTGDRIRETLFNWLQADLHQSRCLDLFAGSGALGLEALSRGAAHCTFIDNAPSVSQQLQQNINTLSAQTSAQVINGNCLEWISQSTHTGVDIIFLDPPFAANCWQACLDAIFDSTLLHQDSLIYFEADRDTPPPSLPTPWQFIRHKHSGKIQYGLIAHIHVET